LPKIHRKLRKISKLRNTYTRARGNTHDTTRRESVLWRKKIERGIKREKEERARERNRERDREGPEQEKQREIRDRRDTQREKQR